MLQLSVRGKNKKEKLGGFFSRLTKSVDETLLSGQKVAHFFSQYAVQIWINIVYNTIMHAPTLIHRLDRLCSHIHSKHSYIHSFTYLLACTYAHTHTLDESFTDLITCTRTHMCSFTDLQACSFFFATWTLYNYAAFVCDRCEVYSFTTDFYEIFNMQTNLGIHKGGSGIKQVCTRRNKSKHTRD